MVQMSTITKTTIVCLFCICSIGVPLAQATNISSDVTDSGTLAAAATAFSSLYLANHEKASIKKKHIVIVTLEAPPFMMRRKRSEVNSSNPEWYGYCMDLFNEMVKHLPYDLTYDIYHVQDNKFGSRYKHVIYEDVEGSNQVDLGFSPKKPSITERWNGLVGDLQLGKADLALAPLAVMAERELVVDFTVPFYDLVGIQILLKKPEVPKEWFKFLTVLDNQVWFFIMLAYLLTSVVMFLFDRLSPYSHKNSSRIKKIKQRRSHLSPIVGHEHLGYANNRVRPAPDIGDHQQFDKRKVLDEKFSQQSHEPVYKAASTINDRHDNLAQRRPSIFFLGNVDMKFGRQEQSDSKTHNSLATLGQQALRRGSQAFTDYLSGIQLHKDFERRTKRHAGNLVSDYDDDTSDVDDGKPDFGLRDSFWFCITSLTPQGGGEAPQNLSGRVVAGSWWLFCFIVISSYTANLAAFLTVSRLEIPIESLDDLAKQYRIKYSPVDGTAEQTYFERMAYIEELFYNIWKEMSLNDSLSEEERSKFAVWDYPISDKYTRIWSQIQQVGMPSTSEAGIQRVKRSTIDDGYALIADANTVKNSVLSDCTLKAVGEEFSRKPIALGLRKGDEQFKNDLSYAILKLINQRFMEVLREKWWTNNPSRVVCENNDESEGIDIHSIGGVFGIICVGVIVSFMMWTIEKFVYKTKMVVSKDWIQQL